MDQDSSEHENHFRREFFLQRVSDNEWRTFKKCTFTLIRFEPYAALRSLGGDETDCSVWAPFRGQSFDESNLELVPSGWDHEHCDVCRKRIEDGDWYWSSSGLPHVDFCKDCFPLVQANLRACYEL